MLCNVISVVVFQFQFQLYMYILLEVSAQLNIMLPMIFQFSIFSSY